MTETLERHQEKLEGKQTACLEQIRELEKQVRRISLLAPVGLNPSGSGQEVREGDHHI